MSDQPEIQPIDATAGLLNLPDVQAVEFVLTVAIHLVSAAAPLLGSRHAAPIRDGLKALQLAQGRPYPCARNASRSPVTTCLAGPDTSITMALA